jgi:ABC-2 type transport system ATP-binding protein
MASLHEQARISYRVRATDQHALRSALTARSVTSTVDGSMTELPAMSEVEAADLLTGLVGDGVRVVAFEPVGSSLESVYLSMTEERR